ncbi:type I restriction endonuclease subunit R [Aquimarina algiphila]|uniref:type I restriction endonuclease subunit R n=1 Tax=Aquimarina algiphila TaxID=2047982 RepID=UPI00232F958C|nr:DEAD/DEAH box helicase family protein [Aquimarina algiphila]
MNEAQTRKRLIDNQLAFAGWNITDQTQVVEEYSVISGTNEPHTTYNTTFSDYVLLGKDGKPLAVIEAKRTSKNAEIGREQAKQYSLDIEKESGELPFCFYTNGLDIYFWDLGNYPPKKVIGFPSRDDLERYKFIRKRKKPLAAELINTDIAGRDYQIQAIRKVMESIEQKRTKFLLVMATGTGKTRTCIALTDVLMRASWAERVLFLVDRIALRDQALEAFKEHLPNEPTWPKRGEKSIATDRRIYVSTYPTMLNIVRDEENTLSSHFFDLIVIDESHRSIYNTYQEVLEYFNTITLGLTATPTDVIDHNTFQLFECEDGLPTFAYSYKEAVNNIPPYLCNFQVMKIHTKFQDEGINKRTVSLEDQKKLLYEGRDIEEINYEGEQLEKSVRNRGTNALIVREFMEESIKDSNGVLPGKSIFFCQSIAQARQIEEIFEKLYPEYNGELSKVLVSDDPRVYGKGGLLDQFKMNDMPRIAISVDMLDTGVDVRELVNLVFAKPVFSYTKFWQMIGRGTRLLEPTAMKPWCTEKDNFLILDCWDNFEYFKLNPKGKENKTQIPLPVRFASIRIDKIEVALELDEKDIAFKEIEILRKQLAQLPQESVAIQDAQSAIFKVRKAEFWETLESKSFDFLRDIILPLFRTVSQVDFKAMRFKKDVLETSLAFLEKDQERFEILKEDIQEQVALLPLSVNTVAKETSLIKKALSNKYWAIIDDPTFDILSKKLAPLMRYIEKVSGGSGIDHLNLKDLVTTKEFVEFGPQHESVSISRYREMVEEKITEMLDRNPILQKIKNGGSITPQEAEELAEELYNEDPHITEALLQKVYKNQHANFIQFIKHVLGIEVLESFEETVSKKVAAFITKQTQLTTRQIEFLNLLRDYVIERGQIHKRNLLEAPFTVIHPKGIQGIFTPNEIKEIVTLTEQLVA